MLSAILIGNVNTAKSQCGFNTTLYANITPTTSPQTLFCTWDGDYNSFVAVAGNTYYFSFCAADGGQAPFDTQITIFDATLTYAGGYNDDFCGLQSYLSWLCPTSGTYYAQINSFYCQTLMSGCADMVYWMTTGGGCLPLTVTCSATPSSICSSQTSQLTAAGPGGGGCNSTYSVSSIAFAPVAGAGTAVALGDDQVSGACPIGFSFCFFGVTYTNAYISSNGFISFDAAAANGCCTGQVLPDATSPNAVIAAAWEDLYPPAGGTIDYFTSGVTPNRIFVARWNAVPHYSGAYDFVTMQIECYETTNVIEIHITSMPGNPSGTWVGHTEGIEDATGATAYTVPGRNSDATWTATNDAWRFTPGGSVLGTYSWTPAGTLSSSVISNPLASPTTTTTYTVTYTDGAGCTGTCSSTVTVTSGAIPTITPSGPTSFCSPGSVTLTSSVGTSYLWSTGATTQSIVVSTGGSYTVTVGTGSSPVVDQSQQVSNTYMAGFAQTDLAQSFIPTQNTSCGASVTLTNVVGTGVADITISLYTLLPNAGGILLASGTATGVAPGGVATVNWASVPVTVGTTYYLVFTSSDNTFGLTGDLGNSYPSGMVFANAGYGPFPAYDYTFQTFSCGGGCTGTSVPTVVTITPPPTPTITASGPTTFCAGGSVTLTSSVGTSYLWSTGATTQSITVSTAGSYTVAVTTGGCTGTSAATVVTINPAPATPTITASGPTTFCTGGSVTLTSSAGTTYLWSTGATTASITPTTSGTYTVTITNGSGCTAISTGTVVTVNVPVAAVITASGPVSLCSGGSVTLTSTAGTSYLWSTGATTQSITVSTAGSYTVTLTDVNGCTSTSAGTTVTVNPNPTVTITAGGPTTFCTGGSVSLTSTAGSSYIWSSGGTTQTISVNTSGSYTVTMTDGNGCTGISAPVVVTVNTPIAATITASGPTTICQGQTVDLSANSGNSYLWSTGATTQVITVSTSGSFSVAVTDGNGCVSTSAVTTVTVNPAPIPTITAGGPTTFCAGGSVSLSSSVGTSYLWSDGGTTQSIVASSSGNYTVIVTYVGGCTATSAVTVVTVNPTPSATISSSGPTTFCIGGSVTLTSVAANSYLWSTGATSASIVASTSGNYSVTITDVNGCTATSAPVSVTVNPAPPAIITASGPTTFCSGGSVDLMASAGVSYLWSTGGTSQAINVTTAGSYSVTITYAGGCTSVSSSVIVNLNIPAPASITASGPTTICQGDNLTLLASSGNSFLWSTGQTTPSISVVASGNYSVVVTDMNGCTSTSPNTTVTVNPTPSTVITASGPTTICQGQNVTLTAAVASTYLWNTGATSQSITVNSSGNYSVILTSAQGCTANSVNTTVTVNPNGVAYITPSGPTTVCPGQTVTLNANAGTAYQWSTSENTQAIVVSTSGSYTVTVTNTLGCTAVSAPITVTVGITQAVVTASGPTTFCQGGNVTLSGNVGSSYLWSSGQTTQSIFVNTAGIYTCTVTYPGNCTSTSAPVTVVVNPTPTSTITPSQDVNFCMGDSITLTANGAPGSYSWSTSATTQSIMVYTPGIYTVTITDANTCYTSSSITLIGYTQPIAGFTSSVTWNTATFTDTSTSALSYYWDFDDGSSSTSSNPSHLFNIDRIYHVTQTVTNPCGWDSVGFDVTIFTTGIDGFTTSQGVYVFPNPVSEQLNVVINQSSWNRTEIILHDILGKQVMTETVENPGAHFTKQIKVSDFAPGVYLLTVKSGNDLVVKKVVIQ